jgi:hypothetical protein
LDAQGPPKSVDARWTVVAVRFVVMEKPLPRSPEESFVVRISVEDSRTSPDRWRATVVHVTSGERRYVGSYGELCTFIETHRRRSARE